MQITPATRSDLPQLVPLLAQLFTQEDDFRPNPDKQEKALRMILEQPERGSILVARQDGKIVGMVNLLSTLSTAEGGKVLILEDLIVEPSMRKQGLGKKLLAEAVAFARQEGYLRISLLTDHMNSRAQALYASFGFKPSAMTTMRLNLGEDAN